MFRKLLVFSVPVMLLFCCCEQNEEAKANKKGGKKMEIKVTSSAFEQDAMIPSKYTCDGAGISPPLQWDDIPEGTEAIALISDDPDAPMGTFVHWVLYDMPADTMKLDENTPPDKTLPNGAKQGITDFGTVGYGGPCPPSGTHRYYFKIYALDMQLGLESGASKGQLLKAMEDHILAKGELMGRYKRK